MWVIDLWSALFGAVAAGVLYYVFNKFYFGFFGGKELRKLRKETKELRRALSDKDKYIRKSLEELDRESRAKLESKENA